MAKEWQGRSFNEDWVEVDNRGNPVTGVKDLEADHANQAAASPWNASASPTPAPATSGLGNAVTDKLFSEMNLTGAVDKSDPAFQQQVEANRFTADRTADRARAAMAQRASVNGTATGGGLDTGIGRILSDQGAQEQGFEAELTDQFRNQNLDRMGRALQLGTGLFSQEQEQALRAALTREGYGLQRELGLKDLDFRRDALGQQGALSMAQLDQNAMMAFLNGG